LPNKTRPEPWSVLVLYVPSGIQVGTATYEEVLAAGGVDVETRFGYERDSLPTVGDPTNPAGGYELFNIGKTRAVVQRHGGRFVTASWLVPATPRRQIEYVIAADMDPSTVVRFARSSREGALPPNLGGW